MSYSSDFGAISGYYTSTWFLAGEVGMLIPFTSYLSIDNKLIPSSFAYADGWQRVSSNTFNFGMQAGYTIEKRVDIILRYGINTKQKYFDNYTKAYTYLGFAINYRIGKVIDNIAEEK